MATFNWAYDNDAGQRFVVGLFHGANTGHLLVYCNARIVLIDFHVLQSANYSFFIEEELCEITIDRQENTFTYNFKVNREVDTPANRVWKQRTRKDRRRAMWLIAAFLLTVALASAFFLYLDSRQPNDQQSEWLAKQGSETITKVFIQKQAADSLDIKYAFTANGQVYENTGRVPALALSNGLPLVSGDEFVLRYADSHPFIHEIDFNRPSTAQVQGYRNRVIDKHLSLHPELSAERVRCLVEIAFEVGGLSALADFYFQDADPKAQALHNSLSFQRLTRDVPFSQKSAQRCI